VAVYAIIAMQFPTATELYTGYLELASGFAVTVGPLLSGFLVQFMGFAGTYLFFGAFITVFGIVPAYLIPSQLDDSAAVVEKESEAAERTR